MALKIPKARLQVELDALVTALFGGATPLKVLLFTNAVTPDRNTVIGDLTEATWSGYSRQTLPALGASTYVSPDAITVAGSDVQFTNSTAGDVTLYGYAVVDNAGVLLWAERDPAAVSGPITLPTLQKYSVTVRRTHRNQGD